MVFAVFLAVSHVIAWLIRAVMLDICYSTHCRLSTLSSVLTILNQPPYLLGRILELKLIKDVLGLGYFKHFV